MLHFFYLVDWKLEAFFSFKKNIFESVFFSFLVRVDYEAPVNTPEDIVNRDDIYRAHFCGSKKKNPERLLVSYIA